MISKIMQECHIYYELSIMEERIKLYLILALQ